MLKALKSMVLAAVLAAAALPPPAAAQNLTVVELFTSQGCSSCPPADRFLGELARRADVLALSVHVDYWDYIGWKDPFASADNTQRQRDYAAKFRLRYVYTPQMVVQGALQATGSDRVRVLGQIAKAAGMATLPVIIRRAGGQVRVSVPAAESAGEAAVWLAVFDREHETPIRRGENAGRTLKNYNVVRKMTRIGTWTGEALEIPAPTDAMAGGRDGCAVIVQSLGTGHILGAARLDLNESS